MARRCLGVILFLIVTQLGVGCHRHYFLRSHRWHMRASECEAGCDSGCSQYAPAATLMAPVVPSPGISYGIPRPVNEPNAPVKMPLMSVPLGGPRLGFQP